MVKELLDKNLELNTLIAKLRRENEQLRKDKKWLLEDIEFLEGQVMDLQDDYASLETALYEEME